MTYRVLTGLLMVSLIFVAANPAGAASGESAPFTIIRATLDGKGTWEVHRFVFPLGDNPPGFVDVPQGATGFGCSILDYTLFRARHVLSFEGALREGLAGEFARRDGIKRASNWGAYFFCPPFWPMHLVWELPFSGIDKERMLSPEGYTIHLPIVESGSIGEIPLEISEPGFSVHTSWEYFTGRTMQITYPPMPEDAHWRGAGLYSHYFIKAVDLSAGSLIDSEPEFHPGWPQNTPGLLLIMLDVPEGFAIGIKMGDESPVRILTSWPGRYEWPLESLVYVTSNEREYLGFRRAKPAGAGPVWAGVSSEGTLFHGQGDPSATVLRNSWPRMSTVLSRHPFAIMFITGIILIFIMFHLVGYIGLRLSYRGRWAGAIYDPVVSHLILLAFATILAPFLGLGWIAGAYVAGKYLRWRHPEARRPWLMMIIYALLLAVIFETIFPGPLWV